MNKTCSICKNIKDISLFYKSKKVKSRYRSCCIECFNKKTNTNYKNNRDKILKKHKLWKQNNKDKILERHKFLLKTNINYRLKLNLRRRVIHTIQDGHKSTSTMNLLGCNIEAFKFHMECQFTEGMTWDNYGINGWHVDHIRPCASFDLTDTEQQKKCFHYTNLQPLWAEDNLSKGDKWEEDASLSID